jgi:hypothetical protein
MNKNFHNKYCNKYNFIPSILPKTRRIIALGDIHGDYNLCIRLLKLGKVIDDNLNWIGNDTIVVQIGDQIDRCRPTSTNKCNMKNNDLNDEHSDIKILKLFTKLDKLAQKSIPPGKVISLLGNHELLNIQGQMNYVSYEGIEKFSDYKDPENPNLKFSSGEEARRYAFKPGNEYGKFIGCTRLGSVIIGSNLFVHAGLIDIYLKQMNIKSVNDLDTINYKIQQWLLGLISSNSINDIISGNKFSMFWNRILGHIPSELNMKESICKENISKVVKILKINSMIIGHTPQSYINNETINSTCSNKIWRIDNGSSKAFDPFDQNLLINNERESARNPQILEILNDSEFNIIME